MRSFRRFVNLVANDHLTSTYNLRRIDMSRFFMPTAAAAVQSKLEPAPAIEDGASLPEPAMRFFPPERLSHRYGHMEFMLVDDKVVATDQMGNAMMYDPDLHAVSMLPRLAVPKKVPVSIAVRNALYVLDGIPRGRTRRNLEALIGVEEEGVWEWHTLPMPPTPPPFLREDLDPTCIDSAAVVDGSHIWFSTRGAYDIDSCCTFAFDTKRLIWSMEPADWALPFRGPAVYVPEHKIWFGVSSCRDRRRAGHVLCASDLAAAVVVQPGSTPPAHTTFGTVHVKQGWHLADAHAVHLGCGKFCVAAFFSTFTTQFHERNPLIRNDKEEEYFLVLAGVEVAADDGGDIHVVHHRSERYVLVDQDHHWLL